MMARLILLAYVTCVVLATVVHRSAWLACGLALVLLSAGRAAPALLRRSLRATLPFLAAVSLGYVLVAWGDWSQVAVVLARLNLRVLLLVALAFRLLPGVDLQRAFGFSPTLRFTLILATSQVLTFRRLFVDFRLALASRAPRRVGVLASLRHGAAAGAWFLRRAEHDATSITHALEARGFFLDRD